MIRKIRNDKRMLDQQSHTKKYVGSKASEWNINLDILYDFYWLIKKVILLGLLIIVIPEFNPLSSTVWGMKPVLGYFVETASLSKLMKEQVDLSETEFLIIEKITQDEIIALAALEVESLDIITSPNLSLEEKRSILEKFQYNPSVFEIMNYSQAQLHNRLDSQLYERLIKWINRRWHIEQKIHASNLMPNTSLRSFEIFATRYDSGGAYYVALPDQCLKLTNGGHQICEDKGYKVGKEYSVFMSYKKGVAARVGEAGPWNIDDNYWAAYNDPTPRRMFVDLPLGMPEAQAAYFNGYNGGVDQFGRMVTAPFGVDLSYEVADDLGLPSKKNDWIQISYLWTEDWGDTELGSGEDAITDPTKAEVTPITLATPQADGSMVHVVRSGQTLWDIAVEYQVPLQELYNLNGISEGDVIIPGDEILVKKVQLMVTPTLAETHHMTSEEITLIYTPIEDNYKEDLPTAVSFSIETKSAAKEEFIGEGQIKYDTISLPLVFKSPFFLLIIGLILLGLVLLLLGLWMNKEP
jgi:LysM repeat protein